MNVARNLPESCKPDLGLDYSPSETACGVTTLGSTPRPIVTGFSGTLNERCPEISPKVANPISPGLSPSETACGRRGVTTLVNHISDCDRLLRNAKRTLPEISPKVAISPNDKTIYRTYSAPKHLVIQRLRESKGWTVEDLRREDWR